MLSSRFLSALAATLLALPSSSQAASAPTLEALSPEVSSRYDLEGGVLQVLSVPLEATSFMVDVLLGERAVTLRMWPHDVRSDNFQLLVEDEHGIHVAPTPASVTLRGRILGEPDSMVSAGLWDGKLQAVVHENLNAPELGVWAIQPIEEFGPQSPWHVVFHEADVAAVAGTCGVGATPTLNAPLRRGSLGLGVATGLVGEPVKVCEIAFDADNQYYNLNLQSVSTTQNDITNILNHVDVLYVRDVAITYEITTILVRTAEPDPYTSSNPNTLLVQFRDHWNSSQGGIQRDIAHLFTGRDINGGVIGIAWLGVICTNTNPYGLSQSRYTGNILLRTSLTAHELGHNWSSPHCNGSSGCKIMCASNGGCGGVFGFGPDSTSFILDHKSTRTCLTDPAPATLASVTPTSMQAYLGGTITVSGTGLSSLTSLEVGSQVYTPSHIKLTIIDDSTAEVTPVVAPLLGTAAVTAVNLAGPSNSLAVTFTATVPPRIGGPPTAITDSTLTYTTGSLVGEQWFLFASPDDNSTAMFMGFPVLTGSFWLGLNGTLSGVGVSSESFLVDEPSLVGRTVYLHSLLVNGGFAGVTNIISTTFIL